MRSNQILEGSANFFFILDVINQMLVRPNMIEHLILNFDSKFFFFFRGKISVCVIICFVDVHKSLVYT
jgi:hypothetical protein